jgi:hypothetical protein
MMSVPTKEEYMRAYTAELHKPIRKHYKKRRVKVAGLNDTFACDLVDMSMFHAVNDEVKWMLTIIDVYSRYAWAKPMKSKSADDVLQAFTEVINGSKRIPNKIWVDEGLEFYNAKMSKYLQDNDIIRYSTQGDGKSVVIERFNRTLKTKMWRQFTEKQTNRWIDMLPLLMESYNHKEHRGLNSRTPYSVSRWPESYMPEEKQGEPIPSRFKLGDRVRISRWKGIFVKGFVAGWSGELFTVSGVRTSRSGDPPMYTLKDYGNERIKGAFYEEEMQKTQYPDVFLVEKVIKRSKKSKLVLVKWLGFPDARNSWIPEADVLQ